MEGAVGGDCFGMRQKPISKEQCETLVRPERPGRSCRPRSNDEHRAERVVRYLLGHAAPQQYAEPLPRSADYDDQLGAPRRSGVHNGRRHHRPRRFNHHAIGDHPAVPDIAKGIFDQVGGLLGRLGEQFPAAGREEPVLSRRGRRRLPGPHMNQPQPALEGVSDPQSGCQRVA